MDASPTLDSNTPPSPRRIQLPRLAVGFVATAVVLLPLTGCSGTGDDMPEVSERDRLEALGNSGLPGAQGINGALDASDAMKARAEAHDTIR